jgi:hypothetical protein
MAISRPHFEAEISVLTDLENIAISTGSEELGPFSINDLNQR